MTEPADGGAGAAPPESLALTIFRLSLTSDGRLPHRTHAGIAVRGGLFAELILADRVSGDRIPRTAGAADSGDRLADSVFRAVDGRRPTSWKRWFSHTRPDAAAAEEELLRRAVLIRDGSGRLVDGLADITAKQAARVGQLLEIARSSPTAAALATRVPVAADDAIVALLVTGAGLLGGRPRPRSALGQLAKLLPALTAAEAGGPEPEQQREALRAAVKYSLIAMRGRAGSRLLSG
jgi:Golgi phosphoprotein 3 GPP34